MDKKEPEKKDKKSFDFKKNDNSPKGKGPEKDPAKTVIMWILVILSIVVGLRLLESPVSLRMAKVPYSVFKEMVKTGEPTIVNARVKFSGFRAEFFGEVADPSALEKLTKGKVKPGSRSFVVKLPFIEQEMLDEWDNAKIPYTFEEEKIGLWDILMNFLPFIFIILIWVFMFRQMQGGQKGLFSFGKSRAKVQNMDRPKNTFADVAGVQEAKNELEEIIAFLKEPKKFNRLGGKIPKGVLLLGPPGTGKTLLARAVAGEAGVPFLSMSGSDFVEMFVGVGASRVRDLFDTAKKNAPSIIFIDEIDAVGRQRGAGLGGGHDEREQTLNQMLVEMDGFEENSGVILIAATNRPDVLDPALLRPGRFDRQVVVDVPDMKGRLGILKVHTKKIPMAPDVDLEVVAKGTPGFVGADLANVVNEAALMAARFNQEHVTMIDFEEAKDKEMMGTERKSLVISDKEKRSTAYHEAGHAICNLHCDESDPLHKVTIIPRGRALGVTFSLPGEDRHSHSKTYILDQICIFMGGRVAEEEVLGIQTTGASNDIERATQMARRIICDFGMTEELGPLSYGEKQEQIFLGREIAHQRDYSDKTAEEIDNLMRKIVDEQLERARKILRDNRTELDRLAEALIEHEMLDSEEIKIVISGEKLESAKKTRTLPPISDLKTKSDEVKKTESDLKDDKKDGITLTKDDEKESPNVEAKEGDKKDEEKS